ncbi:hypothetical protein NDU88_005495 [Pleurodeles waltl]|uniref:Uncharacterized protein n=1 Tax=Pleurodeles waltl TaxID=8319 RepID=A0AAV7W884_PLEWA|nr:hypothetical protein NDU88_005495 [Pleurodeles waltl]
MWCTGCSAAHNSHCPHIPLDKEILETLETLVPLDLPATLEIPEVLKAVENQEICVGLMVPASTKKITGFFKPLKEETRSNDIRPSLPLGTCDDANRGVSADTSIENSTLS